MSRALSVNVGGRVKQSRRNEAATSFLEHNMNDSEQMIREQAYELWDNAGRPDGRGDEFWFAAIAEFERGEETNLSAHVPPHMEPSRHEQ
jgi:Protein of unknown function (DUF2934)